MLVALTEESRSLLLSGRSKKLEKHGCKQFDQGAYMVGPGRLYGLTRALIGRAVKRASPSKKV